MRKLSITKSAAKALDNLDAKQYRQVGRKVFDLLGNPKPADSVALQGAKNGEHRVDAGEYRIIYSESGDVVEVLVIGKRNGDEVYRIWEQMTK